MRSAVRRPTIIALVALAAGCGRQEGLRVSVGFEGPDGIRRPVAGAQVHVVRGDLAARFRSAYEKTPEYRARTVLAAALTERLRGLREELAQAREALGRYPLYRTLGGAAHLDCREGARFFQQTAEKEFLALLGRFGTELALLGIDVVDVRQTPRLLEEAAERERREQARGLVDEYVRDYLALESQVVLDGRGASWDRLCWTIANQGPLGVAWVDLELVADGTPVPPDVAAQYWRAPNPRFRVDFERTQQGRPIAGLAPGESAGGCLYPRRPSFRFPGRRLARFGLPRDIASRSRAWEVRVRRAGLSDRPRELRAGAGGGDERWRLVARPAPDLFAEALQQVPPQSARAILMAVQSSPEWSKLADAQQVPALCERVMELQDRVAALEGRLRAVRRWVDVPPEVLAELKPMLGPAGGKDRPDGSTAQAVAAST